ncbi:hypothetical protein WJX74_010104 [Apatococcus lobatus]|uniref:Uncharacterized protein n=1 Tax=Apatococcus lobatus TaxID=904363 RepID=A0AAW1RVT5_9CHLO
MAKVSSRVLEAGPDSCRVDIHQLEARVLDGQQLLPRAGAALLDELPDQLSVSTWPSQVKGVLLAHKTGAEACCIITAEDHDAGDQLQPNARPTQHDPCLHVPAAHERVRMVSADQAAFGKPLEDGVRKLSEASGGKPLPDGTAQRHLLGFVVPHGALHFQQECDLEQVLPVITDLDETALSAASLRDLQDGQRSRHTDMLDLRAPRRSPMAAQTRWTSAATAEGRIIESLQNIHSSASTVEGQTAMTSSEALRRERCGGWLQLDGPARHTTETRPGSRDFTNQLSECLRRKMHCAESWSQDLRLLNRWSDYGLLSVNGVSWEAEYTPVPANTRCMASRLEVDGDEVVLERVVPTVKNTGMLLRIPPGWRGMADTLADTHGPLDGLGEWRSADRRTLAMHHLGRKLRDVFPKHHALADVAARAVADLERLASEPLNVLTELLAVARLPLWPQAADLIQDDEPAAEPQPAATAAQADAPTLAAAPASPCPGSSSTAQQGHEPSRPWSASCTDAQHAAETQSGVSSSSRHTLGLGLPSLQQPQATALAQQAQSERAADGCQAAPMTLGSAGRGRGKQGRRRIPGPIPLPGPGPSAAGSWRDWDRMPSPQCLTAEARQARLDTYKEGLDGPNA